jgi:hypothetical protein
MKARTLIDGASYGPDALKAIGQAFDEAWASIAGDFDENQVEAARLRLASLLLSIANDESRDIVALKNGALEVMGRGSSSVWGMLDNEDTRRGAVAEALRTD